MKSPIFLILFIIFTIPICLVKAQVPISRTNINNSVHNSNTTNQNGQVHNRKRRNITSNSNYSNSANTVRLTEQEKQMIIDRIISNMVYVEGGTFWMGAKSSDCEATFDEKPCHQVSLNNYYISKFEVTQEEWLSIMGDNPSHFKGEKFPVECVSWNDCQDFIEELNEKTGRKFRLPSEAEWEFAARGGNLSQGYVFAGSNEYNEVAWCYDNANRSTHQVGLKAPNELGLYDMSGNVVEWCGDYYDADYYRISPKLNPINEEEEDAHVTRGGCLSGSISGCRVTTRISFYTKTKSSNLGFRLAI